MNFTDTARATTRAIFVAVFTITFFLLRLATLPLCRLVPGANRFVRGLFFRGWSLFSGAVMGVRFTIHGRPPKAPFLLVTNHLGYLDILALSHAINAVFLSRHDVADWPFFGPITKSFDTLFINRGLLKDIPRTVARLKVLWSRREGILFFPEGTSSGGEDILPLKAGLLSFAADGGLPVHYGTIRYEVPPGYGPASRTVCWWGDMDFLPHLFRMLAIPRIFVTLCFAGTPVTDSDRRELAAKLHKGMLEKFLPSGSRSSNP